MMPCFAESYNFVLTKFSFRESEAKMITDEFMKEALTKTKNYSAVILKAGPKFGGPGADKIIWEHGRRNFALREEGIMPIVCPVLDQSGICGICILNADINKTKNVMDQDPGVHAGIFEYEVHPIRGFPGSALP